MRSFADRSQICVVNAGVVEGAVEPPELCDHAINHGLDLGLVLEPYDGGSEDIFDLQDRITESVVGAIQPSILLAEIERTKRKQPESLDAYDNVLRALPHVRAFDPTANTIALDYFII
jgi:hypothetical protein